MLTPYSAKELSQPESLRRVKCPTFGSCYLSLRDAASLRIDYDSTFVLHRLNPLFQNDLPPSVKYALTGVTYPFVWASAILQPIPSIAALNRILNERINELPQLLRTTTYLLGNTSISSNRDAEPALVSLSNLERTVDRIAIQYRSDRAAVINIGTTYDRHWTASINAVTTEVLSGNYGILSVRVPAGSGALELRYNDPSARLLVWSRYLMVGLAVLMAIYLGSRIPTPQTKRPD
jgi:hypothetical protein